MAQGLLSWPVAASLATSALLGIAPAQARGQNEEWQCTEARACDSDGKCVKNPKLMGRPAGFGLAISANGRRANIFLFAIAEGKRLGKNDQLRSFEFVNSGADDGSRLILSLDQKGRFTLYKLGQTDAGPKGAITSGSCERLAG